MTWSELDWKALDRLRDGFLHGAASKGPYWQSASDLASYDFTYGERIGWKWDHVLRELRLRGWRPQSRNVFDWGCGSGIAGRRILEIFGPNNFDTLTVWDHSAAACEFAAEAAQHAFPGVRVASATPGLLQANEPLGLLVISHVLNELAPDALERLLKLIERAAEVIWVEPGTHDVSRALGALRDRYRPSFRIVAPCTHQLLCPALLAGRERDWCHFFAPPPSEIFAHPDWVKFGQRAGIDLRSLPYCFIVFDRREHGIQDPTLSRVIGRPEHFKPYARVLNCDASGLHELELLKRSDPALFKQLDRTKAPLVYRWKRDGDRIVGGEPLGASAAPGGDPST